MSIPRFEIPDKLNDGTVKPAGYGDGGTVDMGRYKLKTHELPRPTYGDFPGNAKLAEQEAARWDRADFQRKLMAQSAAELDAKRDAERKVKEQAIEARQEELRQDQRARMLAPAKHAFLQSGGSEKEWQEQEADVERQIRQRLAADAALQGENAAQREMRRQYQRTF